MIRSGAPAECPAHIPQDRVRTFDYGAIPEDCRTPFESHLQFRGEPPFWSPLSGGFWVLTDARTVRDAYQRPEDFSNRDNGLGYAELPDLLIPEQLDPPQHRKYRALLASWFTPAAAKRLESTIRDTCTEIVDTFADTGETDLIPSFVGRFPQMVFLRHIINLPASDLDMFLDWERKMIHAPTQRDEVFTAATELRAYLSEVIASRQARPLDNDMISGMLSSEIDGRPVTHSEILNTAFLLFLAGLDTVTAALSMSFLHLATHAEQRKQINDDPALVDPAIEELLRHYSFVTPTRTVTRDLDFHGAPLRAGDRVLPSSVLAARDPQEFERPDEVDFTRTSNRHMAFGAGPHRCLGAHLARTEMKVALEEFHRRVPEYELQPGCKADFHAGSMIGLNTLPLRWDV